VSISDFKLCEYTTPYSSVQDPIHSYFKVENDNNTSPTWQYDLHACIAFQPFETFFRFATGNDSVNFFLNTISEDANPDVHPTNDYFRVFYYSVQTLQSFWDGLNAY